MPSMVFTVVTVMVLGLARPHVLGVTDRITQRAVSLQRSFKARLARKPAEDRHASGA
jgi:hypothetical protein